MSDDERSTIVMFDEEFTADEYADAKATLPHAAHSDQVLYGAMLALRHLAAKHGRDHDAAPSA